ncbi:TVP38/TMEM64 family protein [Longimicrobium sp.]|uniref:TVP38/TMEM64 family protein n=1 Tax=Longimicrobium sp. TaxID=2029185 RepID=UPI002E360A60|nr:TVP38/TMEM64 family protein [Longimicrobium sp.]HEX6038568.1 TVP38/TMEM64 family protein [Longimicrobium sp.]
MTDLHGGPIDPYALEPDPAPDGRRRDWKKPLLAAVIIGAVVAGLVWGGHFDFEALKSHRQQLLDYTHQHYTTVLIGVIVIYTVATALSFPMGIVMTFAVGFLFGRWVGTGIVVLAASVGATLAFLSARYLFADAARRRMGPMLQRMAKGFEEDAFNYILFTRLVPVFPFWLMNLVPAFTPVSARTFFVATLIGILPGTFVFANVGESLARIDSPRDLVGTQTLLALALLGASSLVPIVLKKLRTPRNR